MKSWQHDEVLGRSTSHSMFTIEHDLAPWKDSLPQQLDGGFLCFV